MQNLKLLIGVIGGTLVMVFAVAFLFSNQSTDTSGRQYDNSLILGSATNKKIATSDESTDATASSPEKVTIVEFSDLQCPACKAAQPLVNQLVADNPGKVELVYRHFPLQSIHKNAFDAAVASEFMATQGKFWEFHDVLFEKQEEWSDANDHRDLFIKYAVDLGVAETAWSEVFDKAEFKDIVNKDISDGLALGVDATPTFFVDGEKISTNTLAQTVASKI